MTIRQQILLFVVPLFLGVGLIIGAVAWELETVQAERALAATTRVIGDTLGEFIEPADVAALRPGAGRRLPARLGLAWGRLQRWEIVRRLFLLDPATGRVLLDTAPAGTPLPPFAAFRDLRPDEVRLLPLRAAGNGTRLQTAVALVTRAPAIVGFEISAEPFLQAQVTALGDAIRYAAGAALAGLAVAAFTGWLVSRPIRRLQLAVEKLGTPAFAPDEAGGRVRIQEVDDLGNTLGVMHSVLGDTAEKTRGVLLEGDFYRSERGLTALYQGERQPPAAWADAAAEAAWLAIGDPPPAFLAGAKTLGPAAGAAFVGLAGPATDLATALRAQAAAAYLSETLGRRPLAAAVTETRALFGLRRLVAVLWRDGALESCADGDAGASPPPDPAAWAAGAPVALACLGPVNGRRLTLYLANYAAHPPARALAELPPFLDAAEPGAVLVLRRAAVRRE